MHTIKNLTRQVVLLRFNSGAEVNIAPGAKLEVSPSELRGNRTIQKLHSRRVLDVSEVESRGARNASRASSAAAADDATDDRGENDESPRPETPEPSKKRR